MKFDLKTPCKNCPFRSDATRIKFAGKERAEEIAEQAYRHGFPCHLSADYYEDPLADICGDDEHEDDSGYIFGENTQHCAGALIMFLKDDNDTWPGIGNDEDLADKLRAQIDWNAPVFESEEAFVEANARGRA